MQTGPALALHSLALWALYRVVAARLLIAAQCGEDVTLGCTFPTLGLTASQQVNITWKMQRADGADLLVHSCCFGTEQQAQAYKGRTQLNPEGVSKGDASLRLRDVHIQDEGLYRCYVSSELGRWSEETSLTVLRARKRESPIVAQPGQDVTLSCSFEPGFNLRLLNITWKKETAEGWDLLIHTYYNGRDQMLQQDEAYRGRTQLYPERFHEGDASLRLRDVRLEDAGFYTCHVKPELGWFSVRMRVTVETGALSIELNLVLLLLLLVMVIIIKKHRLRIGWKPRPSKHSFAYEAAWTDGHLSNGSEDKYDDVEGRVQPETDLLWNLRVDDCKQNPVLDFQQLPAGNERHTRENSNQPSFSHGNAPAREKLPRNVSWNPRKKGQWLRLKEQRPSSAGDSADAWTDTFTAGASDLSEADSAWPEDMGSPQSAMRHVAILGQTGAGKSSFINAVRGLGDEEEGAAKTGVVETTMVPTSYQLPTHPNVTLWDLPGFGRTKHPSDPDLDLVSLSQYNAFLIFSAHHFTAAHAGLARRIQRAGKKVYFVRTKVDRELFAARQRRPSTYNEERILQRIRDACVKSLQAEGVTSPQVFLLSNFEYGRHDFPILEKILQQDFGSHFPG